MATETFTSVFDAIAESDTQAINLKVRAELMGHIDSLIRARGWTQEEAARRADVSQPRINDLLRGRISKFSLDALVNIATRLKLRLRLEVDGSEALAV